MLQVIGDVGKSVVADAIKKYNNARIYVDDHRRILSLKNFVKALKEILKV